MENKKMLRIIISSLPPLPTLRDEDVQRHLGPGGGGGREGRGRRGQTEGCGYRDLPPPDGRGPREEERLPSEKQPLDGRALQPDFLPAGRDCDLPGGE